MSRMVDNIIAFKILKMLVQPFTDSEAYHLGIIDAHGKTIRKMSSLTSGAERDAYNYLTRLVFGLKKIINRLPGGENKLKTLIAAMWLVKEQYKSGNRHTNAVLEEKFTDIVKMLNNKVCFVEEEIIVKKFLDEDSIANVTGAGVSTDQPKIYPKHIKKYKAGQGMTIAGMIRRPKPVEVK